MDEQTRLNLEQRLEDVLHRDLGSIPVRTLAMYTRPPREATVHPIRRVFSVAGAAAGVAVLVLVALAAAFALRELKPTPAGVPLPNSSPSPSSAASTQPSATGPVSIPTPVPAGAITGRFIYGSDFIPPVTVYAISTSDQRVWYSVDFAGAGNPPRPTLPPGQSNATYTITGVPPGTYWVVAYRNDGQPLDPGYASRVAICLRTNPSGPCPDRNPLAVTVISGQTASGIDIDAWGTRPEPSPTLPPRPTARSNQAAACRSDQLSGTFEANGVASGSYVVSFRLAVATGACEVPENPPVRFLDANGALILSAASPTAGGPGQTLRASTVGKDSGFLLIQWSGHGTEPGYRCVTMGSLVASVEVDLGGTALVPSNVLTLSIPSEQRFGFCVDPPERVSTSITGSRLP